MGNNNECIVRNLQKINKIHSLKQNTVYAPKTPIQILAIHQEKKKIFFPRFSGGQFGSLSRVRRIGIGMFPKCVEGLCDRDVTPKQEDSQERK